MIRRYQDKDFPEVDYLQKDFYLNPATEDELRDKLIHPSWVFDDDGVIGSLTLCPYLDGYLLWSIIVAPSYRGMGVGSQLMQAAETFCADSKITLHVEPQNPARRLYFRRGYRVTKHIKDFYGSGFDAIEMCKQL
jgi:ribosomal protein S18 acetylase RimI-like enzyme